jgi:hypothetical protein
MTKTVLIESACAAVVKPNAARATAAVETALRRRRYDRRMTMISFGGQVGIVA